MVKILETQARRDRDRRLFRLPETIPDETVGMKSIED